MNESIYDYGANTTGGMHTSNMSLSLSHHSSSVDHAVFFISVLSNLFAVISILLNLAFVLLIRFVKEKTSAYYHYIHNLAIADVLAAVMFLVTEHWPHWSHLIVDPKKHFLLGLCLGYLVRSLPWMFFTAYLFTLCCLTFNQYIAVCRPWKYSTLSSPRVIRISVIVIWCTSSLQLVIPVFIFISISLFSMEKPQIYHLLHKTSYIEMHSWFALYAATILVNIILNLVTYLKIRALKGRRSVDRMSIDTKKDAFITLTILLIASVICRLPFPVMGVVTYNIDVEMTSVFVVKVVDGLMILLLHTNFLVDPFIVIMRSSDAKMAAKTLISVCRKRYKCCLQSKSGRAGSQSTEQVNLFAMPYRHNES